MSGPVGGPPITDLYTRNGFAGPASLLVRQQYTPAFSRVEGDYTPQRLDLSTTHPEAVDPRALPVTVLTSPTVRLEVWQRAQDTPYAVRDVHRDQLFQVLAGRARLETDFGILDIEPLDMVLIPRAVSFRLTQVRDLELIILASPQTLRINPENAAVLSPAFIESPRPYDTPESPAGEYELIIRHGDRTTSYFYDYDPLPIIAAAGAPMVQKFNLGNVHPLSVEGVSCPPARLMDEPSTETMIYYLGARDGGSPPIHHNADYDEIGIFVRGPGAFGTFSTPGSAIWIPKGVIHHGSEETVPEGYVAWLFETRAHLELTAAGRRIGKLANSGNFAVHDSVAETVPAG